MSEDNLLPSLICGNLINYEESLSWIEFTGLKQIHIDVLDNNLVNGYGFSPDQVKALKKITNLPLSIHLMFNNAKKLALEFNNIGVDNIIIHLESTDYEETLNFLKKNKQKFGIGIFPDTHIKKLIPWLSYCSSVLIFTVYPGQRGQKLIPEALSRASSVRELINKYNPNCELIADGGVYNDSICSLKLTGVNKFVIGSALFGNLEGKYECKSRVEILSALLNKCTEIN